MAGLLLELGKGALLHDLATVNNCEARAFLDRRQSMCNNNRSAVAHGLLKGLLDKSLRLLIKSGGGFVEHKDARVPHDSSRDSNALLLTARELAAALSSEHLEAFVERLVNKGRHSCLPGIDQVNNFFESAILLSLCLQRSHGLKVLFVLLIS